MPAPETPSSAAVVPGPHHRPQLGQPAAVDRAGQQHRRGPGGLGHLVPLGRRGALGQVGLGQHDDRPGAGVPGDGEQPVQPAGARRRGQRDQHEHQVHVRGQHLPGRRPAGRRRGPARYAAAAELPYPGRPGRARQEQRPVAGHQPGPGRPDLTGAGRDQQRGRAVGPHHPRRCRRCGRRRGRPTRDPSPARRARDTPPAGDTSPSGRIVETGTGCPRAAAAGRSIGTVTSRGCRAEGVFGAPERTRDSGHKSARRGVARTPPARPQE